MRYITGTQYRACTFKITVKASATVVVYIWVSDAAIANTYLTKRFYQFSPGQEQTFYVQMPLTGQNTITQIFDNPNDKDGKSANFTITKFAKMPLPRQMGVVDMKDPKIKNFVSFAQRFCFNASVLPVNKPGENYKSTPGLLSRMFSTKQDHDFRIWYNPIIVDENGQQQLTPARIDIDTKVIEASKMRLIDMTVPTRFCIFCHEFSHLYMNEDMYDELEADLNGLVIYLGLGYPRFEAAETFLNIFYQSPSDENMERWSHIENFINNFETIQSNHL